jgi:diguanylate cyclase (GGDEF)-like protein
VLIPAAIGAVGVEPGLVAGLAGAVALGASTVAVRARRVARRTEAELDRLAAHDAVSDLPNRRGLHAWLDEDLAGSAGRTTDLGLLLIDLDRFRHVNDMFGREVGDQLIRAVADRIRSVLGPGDRLARFGGDEFVLISTGLTGTSGLSSHAARLIRLIEQPYSIGGQTIRISANVGAVLADGVGATATELLHHADVARYQATTGGSGRVVVYEPAMSSALSPANAEILVREALRDGAFRLVYQPVVDLGTGRIIGAEALLRWTSPDRGTLAPDAFVPVLEETGLIVPVGTWVLQEACREAARLRALLPDEPPPTVTINVSARQLAQDGFAETVAAALRDSGASERQIHLEITEGALMHDIGSAWAVLRQAKALGVKLALDDFGTGYSSLSYVRRFSLDMLKIDKSFIDGIDASPEDRAIVEHVIGLADALGMTTVAEGVERPEQLVWLRRLGCRMAQGYALSRPLGAEDLEALLVRRRTEPFRFEGATPAEAGGAPASRHRTRPFDDPPPGRATPYPDPRPAVPRPADGRDHHGVVDLVRGLGPTATRAATPPPPPATVDAPPMVFVDPALVDAAPPSEPGPEPDAGVDDLVASPATPGPGTTRLGLPRFREYRPATAPPSVDADLDTP